MGVLKTSTTTEAIISSGTKRVAKTSDNIVSSSTATISNNGTISLGINPPTSFGNHEGIYIGVDSGAPQMSLYSNENNYLQWDGVMLLIQAENFTLDAFGNITASNAYLSGSVVANGGSIGSWIIEPSLIYSGSGSTLVSLDSGGINPAISAGSDIVASAPFRVYSDGSLYATNAYISGEINGTSGSIGGWIINANSLSNSNVILSSNGEITIGTGNNILKLSSVDSNYIMWAGNAVAINAPFSISKSGILKASNAIISGSFTAQSGRIGAWEIINDNLSGGNITLDSDGEIIVGSGTNLLKITSLDPAYSFWAGGTSGSSANFSIKKNGSVYMADGIVTGEMRSDNFQTGIRGWQIKGDGSAEFQDARIRGTIETAVFEMKEISVQSGTQWITEGSALAENLSASDVTITVINKVFEVNDYVRLKNATYNEWMLISDNGTQTSDGFWKYAVQRNLSGEGFNAFASGQAVVRLGQLMAAAITPDPLGSGSSVPLADKDSIMLVGSEQTTGGGYLELEGSRDTGPYFGVVNRTGSKYDDLANVVRIGMLRDFNINMNLGNVYGIVIGDENRNLIYTPDTGLSISNLSGYKVEINDSGIKMDVAQFEKQSSVTGNPDASNMMLYFKTDGELYKKDYLGTETKIGGGGTTLTKATSADINAGTDDTKYTTASAIYNSNIAFENTGVSFTSVSATSASIVSATITSASFTSINAGTAYISGSLIGKATSSEVNTGTNDVSFVTPYALNNSNVGRKSLVKYLSDVLFLGENFMYISIPEWAYNASAPWEIVDVEATLDYTGTTGSTVIQLFNGTNDVLSTPLSIDSDEYTSKDSSSQAVINSSYKSLSGIKRIVADIDGLTTTITPEGLTIILTIKRS